jgi:beta-galactosidase
MSAMVEVGRAGLVWDGAEHRFLSGEVHYWRLARDDWPAVLDAVCELGFQAVSTYVPWVVHDGGRFEGPLDVEAFLALVHERGLKAMVRIGPNGGAELETSGWPCRILDDERCQARRNNGLPYLLVTATGHCFPPSYASAIVKDEIARWYDDVVPRVARWQHPDGPVVACQVDNELGYHFQAHTYALDYHPDAIAGYRSFVGDPKAEPPRDGADEPEARRLEWVAWKEHHLRSTLAMLAGWARERGMDRVPIVHNDYPRMTTPHDIGALERSGAVDWAAADIYTSRHGGRFLRDLVRHLCGSTKLPFLAELGAGWLTLPWLLPGGTTALDEEVIHLRALLGGARAANVYMLVERDRWFGSPLSRKGERRPKADFYPRLHALLDELRLEELERDAPVLLVENRTEAARVAGRQTLGGIVPCFNQVMPLDPALLDLPHPDTDTLRAWERGLAAAVDEAGLDCDHCTSAALPDLTRYRVVLMPILDALDPATWAALVDAAERGVIVGVGPRLPTLDGRLSAYDFPAGRVVLLDEPGDAARLLPEPAVSCDDARVDLTVWRNHERQVVVAANNADEVVEAKVGGEVVTLAPFEVRAL